jgi:hypothetical protein
MLGLELPHRADPLLVDVQAAPAKTSTERIAEVIERLCLEAPSASAPDRDESKSDN